MRTIRCILGEPEFEHYDRTAELRYKDEKYEVYSYKDGDGIWGTSYELYEDIERELGKEVLDKWLAGDREDMEVELPFSFVTKQGYTVLSKKTHKPVTPIGEDDLWSMMSDGMCHMPDGSDIEPDAEGSPLMDMGLI